ncbi:sulfotransferase [Sulfurovum sp. CS9]|uniref:sulfotransferase n=1 Tax=Sulfurovum sp. CS9 TaxID=3391146 RepID=UPI0039ED60A6
MKKSINYFKKTFQNKNHNQAFVVISTQRSGTTFLAQLLNSHPNIHMGKELFKTDKNLLNVDNDNYRYSDKGTSVKKHLDSYYAKYGQTYQAVGFTVMYLQLQQNPDILTYIKENNIPCIYLERRNQLKTVISRLKARETGIYHTTDTVEADQSSSIDTELLLKELKILDETILQLGTITEDLSTLTITYESLQLEQNKTLESVQRFLSLPIVTHLNTTLQKTNSDDLASSITNYDEVKALLQTTPFKRYLSMDQKRELIGEKGGAWSEETHMELHANNFNAGLAKFIIEKIQPKNSLEFGSGLGFLSRHIVDNSPIKEAYCIEPNEIKGLYSQEGFPKLLSVNIFDNTLPSCLDRTFDLVFSIEVAEHIEREKHDTLFDFLVGHANNWIVFSGARVGQGGHGHIAERPQEEWKEEFVMRGMVYQAQLTEDIRAACDKKNINHRQNLMIFKKPKVSLIKKIITKLFS